MLTGSVRRILLASILLLALAGLHVGDAGLGNFEGEVGENPSVLYVPKAKYLRPLMIGNEALLADLIWVKTLGYFADEIVGQRKFKYLEDLIELATDLDPRFEKIYIWAGAVYMYNGSTITPERIMASNRILEKGWRTIQNDPIGWRHSDTLWMIPQMIGFNYAIELRDKKRGAPYMAAAARLPGVPELYKTWAATLYKQTGDSDQATRFLENMLAIETLRSQLEAADDPAVREQIRGRLMSYYSRLYGEGGALERIRVIEERMNSLISEWRDSFPYLSFDFFLLIRLDSEEDSLSGTQDSWRAAFDLLAPNEG